VSDFLGQELKLSMHPGKVSIQTFTSGVDFLGWVHFPNHRTLRTTTKRRMVKQVAASPKPQTIQSYLGMLSHGQAHSLSQEVLNEFLLLGEQ
jgi:creatinine amidohydrolase/Fe(II)-dependent formamide hydrolase-like protein